jgi:DNA-binding protein Fis
LEENRQNQQHAAIVLGLSRQGLIKKMKRYSIKSPNR